MTQCNHITTHPSIITTLLHCCMPTKYTTDCTEKPLTSEEEKLVLHTWSLFFVLYNLTEKRVCYVNLTVNMLIGNDKEFIVNKCKSILTLGSDSG